MSSGFCLHPDHQDDAPIGADGRCLTHNVRTLAPSTGCLHQRWINGAWSPCIPVEGEIQRRVCKPVAPGTWRTTLDARRQAPTPVESEQSQQARRFGNGEPVPTLTTAHKPARHQHTQAWSTPAQIVQRHGCAKCGAIFVASYLKQRFCSVGCGGVQRTLPDQRCRQCGEPFRPRRSTSVFCSTDCVKRQQKARAS